MPSASVTENADVATSIQEFWSKDTMRHQLVKGFWPQFLGGEGSGVPLIRKTELVSGGADLIHINVTSPLAGAGISGDETTLEGNEEDLTTAEIQCNTTLYRHAVRSYRRAMRKSMLDLRSEARFRLAEWGAAKMDAQRFTMFASATAGDVPDGVYTPNLYVVGGGTSKTDVETTDKMSVDAIRLIRYKLLDNLAEPVEVDGQPRFFLVITPEQEYDLKQDADYDSYLVNAATRGFDNPIFTGAIAMIDGIVVISHPSVPVASDGGAGGTVRYGKALAFGKEAFVEALDEQVTWVERDFDYGNQLGVAYSFAFGPRRGLEKNSLQVLASATVPS